MKLFFLPHAGGSAKSYCSFKRFLPDELQVIPMELSGRFTRSSAPLLTDIESCVKDLIERHMDKIVSGDYALFGHSMGTLLCTEIVRQVTEKKLPLPVHIFLSGRFAPDPKIKCFDNIDSITDKEIINFFDKGGFSQTVPLYDTELKKQLDHILCSDVRMAEHYYISSDEVHFPCDITVLYGTEDKLLMDKDMNRWSDFSSRSCDLIPFSGGHFYFNHHKQEICRIITDKLISKQ